MQTDLTSPKLSGFTDEVAGFVKTRSKAIRHRGIKISIDRVKEVDRVSESSARRLDVDFRYRVDSLPVQLRLAIWDDRWIWFDARRGSKAGWTWHTTVEGRFVGRDGARELVSRIEATVDASFETEPTPLIEKIWKPALAVGPRSP